MLCDVTYMWSIKKKIKLIEPDTRVVARGWERENCGDVGRGVSTFSHKLNEA